MNNQITFDDKVALNENPLIPDINKVKADDMNEIKSVVNELIGVVNTNNSSLYYKAGDSYVINSNIDYTLPCTGYITSGTTTIYFSLVLPKSLKNLNNSNISIDNLNVTIRDIAGNYIIESTTITNNDSYSISRGKCNENALVIGITKTSAFSSTNNTPVSVVVRNCTISFTN